MTTATYNIREVSDGSNEGFRPYGAAEAYWKCRDHEIMLSGPAETGKTFSGLHKLDALLWKYAGAQAVVVRKVRGTMVSSVLQTYQKKVIMGEAVKTYGGENPVWFDYPNGSRLWLAGMDDPGKALSSERDFIYVNQAEELALEDWETLLTRATGRAGNAPYAQVGGDCNPGGPNHWIKKRQAAGRLKLFESRHEDNPTLYKNGDWTEQGKKSLSILDGLTGVRYWRLRRGQWRAAEGAVYEDFDAAIHIIKAFAIPKDWRRIRVIDFGYTNPFVCQWWALDGEGRMYLYRELYGTKRIVQEWAPLINELSKGESIEATISDHDAEDRATLDKCGIHTIPARKDITSGIQAVQRRIKVAHDGKPRLFILDNALVARDPLLDEAKKPCCTAEEVDCYVWPKGQDGKALKEVPVKEYDHGMDAGRYGVAYIDKVGDDGVLEFSVAAPSGKLPEKTADEKKADESKPVPQASEHLQEVGWQ